MYYSLHVHFRKRYHWLVLKNDLLTPEISWILGENTPENPGKWFWNESTNPVWWTGNSCLRLLHLKQQKNIWFPSHHADFEPEDIDINLPPSVKQPEQLASGMWLFQMGVFILYLFWSLEVNFLQRQEQCCAHLISHGYTATFGLSEEENPFISFYFLPTMQSYSLIIETAVFFCFFFKILACKVDVHSSFIKNIFSIKGDSFFWK